MTRVVHRVDVATLVEHPTTALALNDLGRVELALSTPVVALPYRQHTTAGRLVLIDPADHATAGAAMIHAVDAQASALA